MVSREQIMLKDRMNKLIQSKNYNITMLADGDVNKRVRLGRQFNNPNVEVQFDTLFMLLYMFHDIDARWLIIGEGKMKTEDNKGTRVYATTNQNTVNQNECKDSPVNIGRDSRQIIHDHYLESLIQENQLLRSQVADLKHDKAQLEGLIEFFKSGTK